jgi:hypothetical protein
MPETRAELGNTKSFLFHSRSHFDQNLKIRFRIPATTVRSNRDCAFGNIAVAAYLFFVSGSSRLLASVAKTTR